MAIIAINKEARRQYEVLEEMDAGIVLTGAEVKSAKQAAVNFKGAYVSTEHGELWLKQFHISPYKFAKLEGYQPTRARKLLMKKKEIAKLIGKSKTEGLTIIPLNLYTQGGLIKVHLGLTRGLKARDRRALMKKREVEKRIRRAMKR